ncbi:CHAP domain-containing protein [Lactobacillus hamsteri]|uniref:Phage capsid protein n=1 Tax=Lactobacillus hamsteri DSM 5661 = JCM 6256 TaxID=1423754 RepID=A0A0R1Y5V3_9LACO|nr:CHAP domain-containing protein [Lactobacillus hamsteri]KRM37806.1 phage capsid protein [Lactobacillus hamsteri DSM 5661 = JCM 6256]
MKEYNSYQFTDDSHYKSEMIKKSRKMIGYFHYGTNDQRMDFGNWKHPRKDGFADCSSFIWLVMKQAGYNVGEKAFSTPIMENDAKTYHQYFKQIHAKDVKPGDVVIINVGSGYGPNGHTAIIDGPYKGRKTQIIEIGGIDPVGSVHRSIIKRSFHSILDQERVTYARPINNE